MAENQGCRGYGDSHGFLGVGAIVPMPRGFGCEFAKAFLVVMPATTEFNLKLLLHALAAISTPQFLQQLVIKDEHLTAFGYKERF